MEVRYPPSKGYLSDTRAVPYGNKANGCDTPLCDTISKGYCAIWGVSRTGPLRGEHPRAFPNAPQCRPNCRGAILLPRMFPNLGGTALYDPGESRRNSPGSPKVSIILKPRQSMRPRKKKTTPQTPPKKQTNDHRQQLDYQTSHKNIRQIIP